MNLISHFANPDYDPIQREGTHRLWNKSVNQLFGALLLAGLLFFSPGLEAQYFMQPNNDNTFHTLEQYYQLSYTGAYRDFKVPAEAAGTYLYLEARGGDGGTIDFASHPKHAGNGGQGASVTGYFKVGTAANQIPVGATVRIIIGQAGGSWTNTGQTGHHDGGGGGGTGILFLPPDKDPLTADAPDWHLLMVAGGGGGGHAEWLHTITDGAPANDGELSTDIENSQHMWYNNFCNSDQPIFPGWGATNSQGGGGAGYTLMKDFCDGLSDRDEPIGNPEVWGNSGYGGFHRVNGIMQPVGGAAGQCQVKGNRGGFGFGSGGCGRGGKAGGGGGYSGGRSGDFQMKAQGGGSYVNLPYSNSTGKKYEHGITDKSIDGFVRYRFFPSKHIRYAADPGKALDIFQASTANGANIQLWTYNDNYANQRWIFSGSTIRSVRDLSKCIDVNTGNTANGTNIQSWKCNGGSAQDWVIQGQTIRLYKDQTKCLSLKGQTASAGANIQLWDCNGSAAQNWVIE